MSEFKNLLNKKLILSIPLSKDEDENSQLQQWFCSIDIEGWKDVEIFIQGNMENPYEEFIEMAGKILDNLQQHLNRALKYLKEFFPTQEIDDYDLSTISFGKMANFDEYLLRGFAIAFIYEDYSYEFQYKVKFKEDGWPIGFEGGPL